jgi:hypothetical protein
MFANQRSLVHDDPARPEDAPAYEDMITRIRRNHLSQASNPSPAADPTETITEPDWQREYKSLVRNCLIMKSALFNAGKRLERKHASGQFTFALSGVYGFLVPLFTLQFEPYFPSGLVSHTISFTAATAGAASFVVAMLYQQQDLIRRARHFYEAGRRMNKLGKDLKVMNVRHPEELRRLMHHYDEILADCENHDEIDYEFARLGYRPRDNREGRLDRWIRERRRLDIRFIFQTYSLIAVVWLVPPSIGLWIWFSLT